MLGFGDSVFICLSGTFKKLKTDGFAVRDAFMLFNGNLLSYMRIGNWKYMDRQSKYTKYKPGIFKLVGVSVYQDNLKTFKLGIGGVDDVIFEHKPAVNG